MSIETQERKPAKAWLNFNARLPNADGKGYTLAQIGGCPVYEDGLPMIQVSPNLQNSNPQHYKLAMASNPLRRAINKSIDIMSGDIGAFRDKQAAGQVIEGEVMPPNTKPLEMGTEFNDKGVPTKKIVVLCEVEIRVPMTDEDMQSASADELSVHIM